MTKQVDIITRTEQGYTFGSGNLEGWAFDATCKPQDRERTVRNALLSFLRAQVDGNEERAKAILNLPLPGGSKVYEIMGSELARYAGVDEELIPVITEEVPAPVVPAPVPEVPVNVVREVVRKPKRFLTRSEVLEKVESYTRLQGHRSRRVDHHQNGHKAHAWIWQQAFLAIEVHEAGRAERLTYLPDWARRNGDPVPEYVEHEAEPYVPELKPTGVEADLFKDCRKPDSEPSPAVGELFKDCRKTEQRPLPPAARPFKGITVGEQLQEDLSQREQGEPLKPSRTYQVADNHGPLPGESWLTRTLTETITVSTARKGRTGNRPACELCLGPIEPGSKFTKGSTGSKKAHTKCFEKRAAAKGVAAPC